MRASQLSIRSRERLERGDCFVVILYPSELKKLFPTQHDTENPSGSGNVDVRPLVPSKVTFTNIACLRPQPYSNPVDGFNSTLQRRKLKQREKCYLTCSESPLVSDRTRGLP